MEYTLFEDYITLQSLLKELGIIQSGGAIKSFLAENDVCFNGEKEDRRGKKIRIGDIIEIKNQNLTITLREPSLSERQNHLKEIAEKERVATLVKKMNKANKQQQPLLTPNKRSQKKNPSGDKKTRKPVRFPGT